MILDLQVDQPDRMPGAPRRLGYEFETERLEPQEYPRIEQRAGMDAEKPHQNSCTPHLFGERVETTKHVEINVLDQTRRREMPL